MTLEEINQKVKIRVDKQLWEILSGQITVQRRTKLPVLTISTAASGRFNIVAQKLLKDAKYCNLYKLKNGIILLEATNEGLLKITKYTNTQRGISYAGISVGSLKRYIFNELKNQKLIYHFYLHPTQTPGLFVLKELTNSWE